MHKSKFKLAFYCLILQFVSISVIGQDNFLVGYEKLNQADLPTAIQSFEKVKDNEAHASSAQLALMMLYGRMGKIEESQKLALNFIKNQNDPYPFLFPIWREPGLSGDSYTKSDEQIEFIKAVSADARHKDKLGGAINYALGTSYMGRMNYAKSVEYYNNVGQLKDWSFLGPFDNVMNSGINKDVGALSHPEFDHIFSSLFNTKLQWFVPSGPVTNDGYIVKNRFFYHSNTIIYAQSFVKSEDMQEVLMKIGFSGSVKIWLNDNIVMQQDEPLNTEMDFFTFQCSMQKGYNRILVQLGDYETSYPNFSIRITDLKHNNLNPNHVAEPQDYVKQSTTTKDLGNFSIDGLKKSIELEPKNNLYKILLAKAYLRTGFYDDSETILLDLFDDNPRNFFVLRNLILLYADIGNNTEQNRYYALFKENYPEFRTILVNEISKQNDNENVSEMKASIAKFNRLYPSEYEEIRYNIILAEVEEDYNKVLSEFDKFYKKFPNDYNAVFGKYTLTKNLKSDANYNKILENYLEKNYNFKMVRELAQNYLQQGKIDDAISLYELSNKVTGFDAENVHKVLVFLASKKEDYDAAKKYCFEILANRPSDYMALKDLAVFNRVQGHADSALYYYEKANEIFPFSFDINEKIQVLKGNEAAIEMVPYVKPKDIIAEFEKNFKTERAGYFDIVYDQKTEVLFKSNAMGEFRTYLLRLNNQDAIEEFQELNFSTSQNYELTLSEVKTIKANGNEIKAEQSDNRAVFLNLEVGDYIYVSYNEKQVSGGKSTLYEEDDFSFSRMVPAYKLVYHMIAENGSKYVDTLINGTITREVEPLKNFTRYSYRVKNVEPLDDETLSPPFNDIADVLHTSHGNSWDDIVEWYSDLSSQQAMADLTIKRLVKGMFSDKLDDYTELEKAKIIYDFVCKNIKYSSIDFRQSNIVPQKASDIYHSRLGDCKDVSTLYAALAREAGLSVSLVLIYTSDNGYNSVVLPSLNFNHCIVKLHLENGPIFLELTDSNLPFGHLYYFHKNAPILEIPFVDEIKKNAKLEHLQFNKGFNSDVNRSNFISIAANGDAIFKKKCIKTGARAAAVSESYFASDSTQRFETMTNSIIDDFTTKVTLQKLTFDQLEPLKDSAIYRYEFKVEKALTKIGSFKAMKIPFTDELAKLSLFDKENRTFVMDFNLYENTDVYKEQITIEIDPSLQWLEVPQNVDIAYADYHYILKFNKTSDNKLEIFREFKAPRELFDLDELNDLREFIGKVVESENTQLVMK